jgi:hypothetical protein
MEPVVTGAACADHDLSDTLCRIRAAVGIHRYISFVIMVVPVEHKIRMGRGQYSPRSILIEVVPVVS